MRVLFVPLLCAVACSDYELTPGEDVKGAGDPDIAADPMSFDEIVCGAETRLITVSNEGGEPLTLDSAEIGGAGWSLAEPFEAQTLSPGGQLTLTLNAGPGEASLILRSDDPDEPTLTIPLAAVADAAPALTVLAPTEGEIVAVSGDYTLAAEVIDDKDSPETLAVSWRSDVDGPLGEANASATGVSALTWTYPRGEGPHSLTAAVTDSCGNTAEVTLNVCQQAGYTASELDLSTWHFEGVASWVGEASTGYLELTPVATSVVGTAFQTSEEVNGGAVEIRFSFYIGDGTGADGLSLTALDTSRMTTFLGGAGCGIGYGGGSDCTVGPALPGWSIELDTFYNGGYDPTADDHIAFTFDGLVGSPAYWASLPELEDTGWHTLEVYVSEPHVTVILDGSTVMDADLSGLFNFPAYVGFTAGTGGDTNHHWIDALEVTRYVCGE
ncbi:hypothetical protein L6R49_25640 [Myxococcota bacterium]|nr:hypothetical protein [Myxococcota bacterium]